MPVTQVDLLVPELVDRDAIGTHSLIQRDVLVELGAEVRFVAQEPSPLDEAVTLVKAWTHPADVVILQHGIGSLVAEAVIERQVTCVLNYHNITPPEFVEPWHADRIAGLRWGRVQVHQLAPLCRRAVCDSQFNADELLAAGYPDVRVSPVMWRAPDPADRQPSAEPTVLFVGRVTSNKCHEDAIAAFAVLVSDHPAARLVFVGSAASEPYQAALHRFAAELGIADRVDFIGSVSDDELRGWYARASVFLCLSEHEGFCVPVVEAMGAGVPVVAFRAAAVPETVGDAGIVLSTKEPATVAAAVSRVLRDDVLAAHLQARGLARAADFALDRSRASMRAALEDLVAGP